VKATRSRYLAGAAGAALLAGAIAFTGSWEGRRYVAYQDSGGVWTLCDGHTKGVHKGMRATDAQCDAMLAEDIIEHETGLLACAPQMATVPGNTYIAINDWAFNVGVGAACKSTLIRKVKAGDLRGACNELSRWVYVNGKVIAGLRNRRVAGSPGRVSERALCVSGLS
jgi:lysozyme